MRNIMLKTFLCCTLFSLFLFLFMSLRDYRVLRYYYVEIHDKNSVLSDTSVAPKYADINNIGNKINKKEKHLKYILQWTSPKNVPFVYMGIGRKGFISRSCPHTNCFVTANRNYFLGNVTKFDVIAFAGPEVLYWPIERLPKFRSPHQKYAFASIESSHNYPVCSNRFNGFFNWTWTFRLDSDVRWGYMLIKDANNTIVGPNKIMHWIKLKNMDPVSEKFKEKIKSKSKAAAWFVSNCLDNSGRLDFAKELQNELQKYNHVLDIYGNCGTLSCPRDSKKCNKLLQDTYYFYLSFENSFSEDYATEKLRTALNNNIVPIVYGGANYSRFMPDGIYLNARELGVQKLAEKMDQLIKNRDEYANYFKWQKYYSYHRRAEFPETDEYCMFCTILNDEEKVKRTEIVENFRDWWDNPKTC